MGVQKSKSQKLFGLGVEETPACTQSVDLTYTGFKINFSCSLIFTTRHHRLLGRSLAKSRHASIRAHKSGTRWKEIGLKTRIGL